MESKGVAVIAIGGNSLVNKGKESIQDQLAAVRETCKHIADLIEQGWTVAVGHGNGPQVGFVLRRSEVAHRVEGIHEVPLDVCGADTQGATGYMLQQSLSNEFLSRGIQKDVATVVTQMQVDLKDPAFQSPSKPIGTFMEKEQALEKKEKEGWSVVEDAGRGWRRVVPSPLPMRVVEEAAVKGLIEMGICVITVGGGGIPVVADEAGKLSGIAAVIDKDYASSLLGNRIGAKLFIISTAVEKVALNFGKPDQVLLDKMTVAEAKAYLAEGKHFAKGSMAPKVQAAIWFIERGGERAVITNPENIGRALKGETGTWIVA
ncbi:MAG TPA: carbamate kinase [Anaerolineales bacterium]|nr:carbamate kinase [Anaerolineales bacterium]HRF46288.1 carbamate kinase [Anaerolineales bacterium]